MRDEKKVIVVGGGISGLAAGCYLQMNGFSSEVHEMAPTPGGVTAAWKRKGYTFDGATNWFPGSGPRLNFYPVLTELLDFKTHPLINFEKFMQVRLKDGSTLDVFTNAEKLRAEMLRISPADNKNITEFIEAIYFATTIKLPVNKARELFSVFDYLKIGVTSVPMGLFVRKWRNITIAQFAERFESDTLRQLFVNIFPRHHYFSVLGLIMALAWMHIESAGYPMGGSNWVISSLTKKYEALGGKLFCASKVASILTDDKGAHGIALENGAQKNADAVIAACDGFSTHYRMLEGKYSTEKHRAFFDETPVFPALIQVSLGIRKDLSKYVHKTVLGFSTPIASGSDAISVLQARFCHFDEGLSPDGGTSVIVHLRTHDFQYWVDLRKNDKAAYLAEKQRVTDEVITVLDDYCGPLRDSIEVIDTATPATYIRYTDTFKGSYQSWAPIPALIGNSLDKKLPGLKNVYMCGQWVEPAGGLPRAVFSARNTVQLVCRDNGIKFVTAAE